MAEIAQFPDRSKEPHAVVAFPPGYLEDIYFGGGWKRLADVLAMYPGRIPLKMMDFVAEMRKQKGRPTEHQLGQMVGMLVWALSYDVFKDFAKVEKANRKAGNVVQLPKSRS